MDKKTNAIDYYFRNLQNISDGYGGFSFESASSLVHHHADFYEFTLITKGKWQHTIGNVTTSLFPGTLLFFMSGVTHLLFTDTPQSTHFVFCVEKHFFERYVRQIFPGFDLEHITGYLSRPISSEKMRYIEYLGKNLCRNPKLARTMGNELLLLCISDFMYMNDSVDSSVYVTDIIQKLNNHIYVNTSVKDICAKYPVSQAMLLQQFKKITGMTIVQYKTKQKMRYACELLTQTQLSLIEISFFLQYDSLSYFMNTFKKTYGITPSEYRKKYSSDNEGSTK